MCRGGAALPTQPVVCVIMWAVSWLNDIDSIVFILVLSRLCCGSGIVCGLLVVSQHFIENGSACSTERCSW